MKRMMNEQVMQVGRGLELWGAKVVLVSPMTVAVAVLVCCIGLASAQEPDRAQELRLKVAPEDRADAAGLPASAAEARDRARLLHETIHGALQVVHRDFFSEERSHTIPSRSLEDVFSELKKSHGVTLRWLAVNATAMSVDNQAADEFEEAAVKAIASGATHHEAVEADHYRYAGRIRLASQCLKCHLPKRTDTADRAAGLLISMPLQPQRQ